MVMYSARHGNAKFGYHCQRDGCSLCSHVDQTCPNLGVYIDSHTTIWTSVTGTAFCSLASTAQHTHMCSYVCFPNSVVPLVINHLYYNNVTFCWASGIFSPPFKVSYQCFPRQIIGVRPPDRITDYLASLHWLCMSECIIRTR